MAFLPDDYDLDREWKKVKSQSPQFIYPSFFTHLHYVKYIHQTSNGLRLNCPLKLNKRLKPVERLYQKVKLIELTFENINEEFKNITNYPEYAVVCVSWIPVKSYYLVFNLLIITECLVCCDENCLTKSHLGVLGRFKKLLRTGQLVFNLKEFNEINRTDVINGWKIPVGMNVRSTVDSQIRYREVIKKLLDYKKEEYKRVKNIERLGGKNKQDFLAKTTVNLCDFLYLYRIKANYRDMEFIDKGVPVKSFVDFYSDYYQLTINFYSAFKDCINNLSQIRLGSVLLN